MTSIACHANDFFVCDTIRHSPSRTRQLSLLPLCLVLTIVGSQLAYIAIGKCFGGVYKHKHEHHRCPEFVCPLQMRKCDISDSNATSLPLCGGFDRNLKKIARDILPSYHYELDMQVFAHAWCEESSWSNIVDELKTFGNPGQILKTDIWSRTALKQYKVKFEFMKLSSSPVIKFLFSIHINSGFSLNRCLG